MASGHLPVVLRDPIDGRCPKVGSDLLFKATAQNQSGPKADSDNAQRTTAECFKMETPHGITVVVGHVTDTDLPERWRYDCHAHALRSFEKHGYFVSAESVWAVYNDSSLFTVVKSNYMELQDPSTGLINKEKDGSYGRLSANALTEWEGYEVKAGDCIVMWETCYKADHQRPGWYLWPNHSFVVKSPAMLPRGGGMDWEKTVVSSKNGSDAPADAAALEVAFKYDRFFNETDSPVGIYRPVSGS